MARENDQAQTEAGASYAHGTSPTPLKGLTVGGLLAEAITEHPENDALVVPYQGVRWSYAELGRQADEVAAGLVALGLEPGDRIGVWAPNSAEWVTPSSPPPGPGSILVNINPAYRLYELEFSLNQVG